MRSDTCPVLRPLIAAATATVLLGAGPCLRLSQEALIRGFFDAVTPLLVQCVADELGISAGPPDTLAHRAPDRR